MNRRNKNKKSSDPASIQCWHSCGPPREHLVWRWLRGWW